MRVDAGEEGEGRGVVDGVESEVGQSSIGESILGRMSPIASR